MVRVIQPNIPPEWEELWNKIIRWFEIHGIPVWCRMWFQDTRSGRERRRAASLFTQAAQAWKALDDDTKHAWKVAAKTGWNYYRGYRLFIYDWIYRYQHGLSVPGTPSNYHQGLGLTIDNPNGLSNVYARRDDKDLVGPLTLKVSYKKVERTPAGSGSFQIQAIAYYLWSGQILEHTNTFTTPSGNVDWNTVTQTFGTDGLDYFHLKVIYSINNYNCKVYLDNVIWSDKNGEFFRENFDTTDYKSWTPVQLYRKKDWYFNPAYIDTYFKHEYLT